MANKLQIRRDSQTNWELINPIIADGELIYISTLGDRVYDKEKVGDGVKTFSELPYKVAGGGGVGDITGPSSSVDSNFIAFDGTTGKVIKDSGKKATDFVLATTLDANTILYATADNTPAALPVAVSTLVGRKDTGDISAMSKAEVLTVLNIEDGANKYIHPTGDGSQHVPATGTVSNGKVLTAGNTAGAMAWKDTMMSLAIFQSNTGTPLNPRKFKWTTDKTVSSVLLMSNCTGISITIASGSNAGTWDSTTLVNKLLPANTEMTINSLTIASGHDMAEAIIIF